jgi:hypothetical protein
MMVHRIATPDLSREAFLSNFIDYLALRTGCVADDRKPVLIVRDAMDE